MLCVRRPGRLSEARDASPSPLTTAGPGPWAQEAPRQVDQARLSPGKGPRQMSPRRGTGSPQGGVSSNGGRLPVYTQKK